MQRALPLILAIAAILLIGAVSERPPTFRGPATPAAPISENRQARHPGTFQRSGTVGARAIHASDIVRTPSPELAERDPGAAEIVPPGDCRVCPAAEPAGSTGGPSASARPEPSRRASTAARGAESERATGKSGIWLMERRGAGWSAPVNVAAEGPCVIDIESSLRRLQERRCDHPVVVIRRAGGGETGGEIGPGGPDGR